MPLNGSGTEVPAGSTVYPAVTTTTISSTDFNALMADFVTVMSTAMYKDGQATPTADIKMGGFKLTNLGAATTTGDALRFQQVFPTLNTTGPVNETKTTVASATTPDIWTLVGNVVDYTGTTTATGFAAAPQAGARRNLVCAGAAPFTAGANMLIQGIASGSTYTATAGDQVEVVAITTTQFRLTIKTANGLPVVSTQTANTVFAGPSSGGATAPTFRALVAADLTAALTYGTQCVQNPIANSTVTTQAHGLSRKPDMVVMWLECLSGELGYSVGDRTDGTTAKTWEAVWDATNVKIVTNASSAAINRKDTGVLTNITLASWKVVAQPILFGTTF